MIFFEKSVGKSKKDMIDFLTNHPRYHTMNSWNQAHSYAHCVKLRNLCLPRDVEDTCYSLLDVEEFWGDVEMLIDDNFNQLTNYNYQIWFNGRSNGYMVLGQGGRRLSQYKSRCVECGQRNCNPVTEKDRQCGKCGKNSRKDFEIFETFTQPGLGLDMDRDYFGWNIDDIRDRVGLVRMFDSVCDMVREHLIIVAQEYEVVDETYSVPKIRKVLQEKST